MARIKSRGGLDWVGPGGLLNTRESSLSDRIKIAYDLHARQITSLTSQVWLNAGS
jgi:hypothetical protein